MGRTYYRKGDWNVICDVSGKKLKASQTRLRWDGLRVQKSDYEERHPQDFVRAIPDNQSVPWTRPDQNEVEIETSYEYSILNTLTFEGSFDISGELFKKLLSISFDDNRLYTTNAFGTSPISQYSFNTPGDFRGGVTLEGVGSPIPEEVTAMWFDPTGENVYILSRVVNRLYQFTLSVPGDILSTLTAVSDISLAPHSFLPTAGRMSGDKTKMYIVNSQSNEIVQYYLPSPGNISGMIWEGSSNMSGSTSVPFGMIGHPDGSFFSVYDFNTRTGYEFDMDNANNTLSGTSLKGEVIFGSSVDRIHSVNVNSNGTKLYLSDGNFSDKIVQFSISPLS